MFHHPSNPNWKLSVPKFDVRPGQVVAVVGRIGAGKSSLISAILGQMNKDHGSMQVGGSISYVPQNPWLQNLSLKENVVFGEVGGLGLRTRGRSWPLNCSPCFLRLLRAGHGMKWPSRALPCECVGGAMSSERCS